ncbi:hypothetical protein IAD21_05963 [Abditibacteriota bacterium]|nr:hypothetical protein IAD21_05963 [Abditibacteriota bacterium]
MRLRLFFTALFLALLVSLACAQSPSPNAPSLAAQGLFPFTLPWDDGATGPTDVSFLNAGPAGASGFLKAQGENFVDEKGQLVRLWGVNLNFTGAFPDQTQAPKIAARLAKFGFNAVRIHHIEGLPSPGGIWKADGSRFAWPNEIDPAQLDRLDFFVAQLIQRGIYIDFNLHVARKVTERDGFLDASKLPEKDKGIPYFDDRLVARNRDYARMLLTHVNPYTTRAYKDEPGVCAIEVDNESSLLQLWLDGKLDDLPPTYAEAIRYGWNEWVRQKYQSDVVLKRAYTELDRPLGSTEYLIPTPTPTPRPTATPRPTPVPVTAPPPLAGGPMATPTPYAIVQPTPVPVVLSTLDSWQLRLAGGARGVSIRDELAGPAVDGIVQPGLSVRLDAAGTVSWGFQLVRDDLALESGKVYTLSFAARSPNGRAISVNLWETRQPYRWLGVKQVVRLRDDWSFYRISFRPVGAQAGFVRLSLDLGNIAGSVQIGAISLRGGGRIAAPDDWSTRGNLPLISAANEPIFAVRRDFARYLGAYEEKHTLEWRRFLKDELKVRVPIWQSQAQFGGWGGALRELNSDALDVHIYWKHPEFGGVAWDGTNWRVGNQSMAATPATDPLVSYSLARATNKPLVVTEWNSGQPNDYGAETLLMAASQAAHQGWAGVWMFDYHSNGAWNRAQFENFFSIDSNPVKMATAPLAALLYRRGDVAPSNSLVYLALPPDRAWDEVANAPFGPTMQTFVRTWANSGATRDIALTQRAQWLGAAALFPTPSRATLESPGKWTSDTKQIYRNGLLWSVNSPRSKAFAGFVGGQRLMLGELEAWFPSQTNGALTWVAGGLTAMDGQTVGSSRRLLVTLCGRAENPNMGWNATRDSVGSNWGTGPTYVSAPPATLKVWTSATTGRVWALDEKGQRRGTVPSVLNGGAIKFSPSNVWRTLWYEIELS